MSLVINIDTTSATALVNIAADGIAIFEEQNEDQKDHAAFLHPAIQSLIKKAGASLKDVDAIAVSHGPGSYTGIRVGVAAAKGLCYASGKPLIVVNELEILTQDAYSCNLNTDLYCPMIDARRMEVFTAVYDKNLQEVLPPSALIVSSSSFDNLLAEKKMLFFGSGTGKWKQLCTHQNALYSNIINRGLAFSMLSFKKFKEASFASLVYSAPLYIKDFHTGTNV
jgi:tRNA threonylcarbamoyladenosine biosynthesis protein TsaB